MIVIAFVVFILFFFSVSVYSAASLQPPRRHQSSQKFNRYRTIDRPPPKNDNDLTTTSPYRRRCSVKTRTKTEVDEPPKAIATNGSHGSSRLRVIWREPKTSRSQRSQPRSWPRSRPRSQKHCQHLSNPWTSGYSGEHWNLSIQRQLFVSAIYKQTSGQH